MSEPKIMGAEMFTVELLKWDDVHLKCDLIRQRDQQLVSAALKVAAQYVRVQAYQSIRRPMAFHADVILSITSKPYTEVLKI